MGRIFNSTKIAFASLGYAEGFAQLPFPSLFWGLETPKMRQTSVSADSQTFHFNIHRTCDQPAVFLWPPPWIFMGSSTKVPSWHQAVQNHELQASQTPAIVRWTEALQSQPVWVAGHNKSFSRDKPRAANNQLMAHSWPAGHTLDTPSIHRSKMNFFFFARLGCLGYGLNSGRPQHNRGASWAPDCSWKDVADVKNRHKIFVLNYIKEKSQISRKHCSIIVCMQRRIK